MESVFLCLSSWGMIMAPQSLPLCQEDNPCGSDNKNFTISVQRPSGQRQNPGWQVFINSCRLETSSVWGKYIYLCTCWGCLLESSLWKSEVLMRGNSVTWKAGKTTWTLLPAAGLLPFVIARIKRMPWPSVSTVMPQITASIPVQSLLLFRGHPFTSYFLRWRTCAAPRACQIFANRFFKGMLSLFSGCQFSSHP